MTIIVKHKKSQNHYILIGTGFGIYQSARPNALLSIFTTKEEDFFRLIAVSDRNGTIKWFESEDLTVVKIDGKKPQDLL